MELPTKAGLGSSKSMGGHIVSKKDPQNMSAQGGKKTPENHVNSGKKTPGCLGCFGNLYHPKNQLGSLDPPVIKN